MLKYLRSLSKRTKAIYLIWVFVNFVLLLLSGNLSGIYSFNSSFFPFENGRLSFHVEVYDYSEFIIYSITPIFIYIIVRLWRDDNCNPSSESVNKTKNTIEVNKETSKIIEDRESLSIVKKIKKTTLLKWMIFIFLNFLLHFLNTFFGLSLPADTPLGNFFFILGKSLPYVVICLIISVSYKKITKRPAIPGLFIICYSILFVWSIIIITNKIALINFYDLNPLENFQKYGHQQLLYLTITLSIIYAIVTLAIYRGAFYRNKPKLFCDKCGSPQSIKNKKCFYCGSPLNK